MPVWNTQKVRSMRIWVGLLFLALTCNSAIAAGPKFTEIPFKEPSPAQRKLARDFIKGGAASAQSQAAIEAVIKAEMSKLTSSKLMANYGSIRTNLYNEFLASFRPSADAARKVAVAQIARYGGGIATSKNFSPQARINALSLLAVLDDYPTIKSTPPRPAKAALRPLIQIARDKAAPVYLRSIALYGVERHIGRSFPEWAANIKKSLGSLLVEIMNSKPGSDLEIEGHSWMVRRALDCAAATKSTIVADRAVALVGDPKTLPSLRLSAASYLSMTRSDSLKEEQKKAYLVSLSHLARSMLVDWYEHEDDLLNRDSKGSGGMYGGMGGGMGGMGGMGDEVAKELVPTPVESRTDFQVSVEFYGVVKIYNPVRENFLRLAAGQEVIDETHDPSMEAPVAAEAAPANPAADPAAAPANPADPADGDAQPADAAATEGDAAAEPTGG